MTDCQYVIALAICVSIMILLVHKASCLEHYDPQLSPGSKSAPLPEPYRPPLHPCGWNMPIDTSSHSLLSLFMIGIGIIGIGLYVLIFCVWLEFSIPPVPGALMIGLLAGWTMAIHFYKQEALRRDNDE